MCTFFFFPNRGSQAACPRALAGPPAAVKNLRLVSWFQSSGHTQHYRYREHEHFTQLAQLQITLGYFIPGRPSLLRSTSWPPCFRRIAVHAASVSVATRSPHFNHIQVPTPSHVHKFAQFKRYS
jgi:hypothetical protein